ncbi:hypothetical protein ACA910_010019 [Epithemia clementina (nom. ined.)]
MTASGATLTIEGKVQGDDSINIFLPEIPLNHEDSKEVEPFVVIYLADVSIKVLSGGRVRLLHVTFRNNQEPLSDEDKTVVPMGNGVETIGDAYDFQNENLVIYASHFECRYLKRRIKSAGGVVIQDSRFHYYVALSAAQWQSRVEGKYAMECGANVKVLNSHFFLNGTSAAAMKCNGHKNVQVSDSHFHIYGTLQSSLMVTSKFLTAPSMFMVHRPWRFLSL